VENAFRGGSTDGIVLAAHRQLRYGLLSEKHQGA